MSRARRVALDALQRITGGAYANLVLPALLEGAALSTRDRDLVSELVYGTTRMRRALDFEIDRYARGPTEPVVRDILRLGAYQLRHTRVPRHAAVSETVSLAPLRARGFANAVLRTLAGAPPPDWPDRATELSYPDWIAARLEADLGAADAEAAMVAMNRPPPVHVRADGYVQDLASQWVAAAVDVEPGEVVVDLCAAPGGKATAMAHRNPGVVVAADVNRARVHLVAENAARTSAGVVRAVVADARHAPVRLGAADRVLVDAPCSGLGVLRRRPDARWRITEADVTVLADLQREILAAAAELIRPGGALVYSVCTLTAAETEAVDEWMAASLPGLRALPPPGAPWRPLGRGARLLPQDADTDGMYILKVQRDAR